MITVSSRVQQWLGAHPTVQGHLADGIINHSSLARTIRRDIEHAVGEKVSIEAITIALNRAGKELAHSNTLDPLSFIGDVSVQTGLSILNFDIDTFNTLELPPLDARQHGYFVTTRGIWHASIITTQEIAQSPLLAPQANASEHEITSTTIRLKKGHIPVPGVCAGILTLLSNSGVNFSEIISTHNELTILTDQSNADKALQTLMRHKNNHA